MQHPFSKLVGLVASSLIALVVGCAGEPANEGVSEGANGAANGAEGETAVSESALSFSSTYYDSSTQCTVGGVTMHCCASGYAMIGAHINNNVFKCGRLSSGMINNRSLDGGTIRNGMHACPSGQLMVGLHVSRNLLTCQTPVQGTQFEYVDSSTVDGYPMHVCATNSAMAGIHVNNNQFTCDF